MDRFWGTLWLLSHLFGAGRDSSGSKIRDALIILHLLGAMPTLGDVKDGNEVDSDWVEYLGIQN
jgi:hypothetical protein